MNVRLLSIIIICLGAFWGLLCSVSSCASRESESEDPDEYVQPYEKSNLQDSAAVEIKPLLSFATPEDAREYMRCSEHNSEYQGGILYRMADESLDYCTNLLKSEYDYFIVVDKRLMKVFLYDKYGREVKAYGMCCAKNYGTKHKKRDSRTPEGFFSVKGVYDSSDWLFTDDDGHTSDKKGQFGPRFIRLDIPVTTQIGIHGTCAPWSIGHRSSHGCIRIKNENILELVEYVKKGMPVIISPGSKDMAVNRSEGVNVPQITTRLTDNNRNNVASSNVGSKTDSAEMTISYDHPDTTTTTHVDTTSSPSDETPDSLSQKNSI